MSSSNSVMNRIRMFEQQKPAEDSAPTSTKKFDRQSPSEPRKFERQSPVTMTAEPKKIGSQRHSYTPPNTSQSFAMSPSPPPVQEEVAWPTPEVSTRVLPSQVKSQQAKKKSPPAATTSSLKSPHSTTSTTFSAASGRLGISSQKSTASSTFSAGKRSTNGVLGSLSAGQQQLRGSSDFESRNPAPSKNTSPTNSRNTEEAMTSPEVAWPSPETGNAAARSEPLRVKSSPREGMSPNPASQDENEAPKAPSLTKSSPLQRNAPTRRSPAPFARPALTKPKSTASLASQSSLERSLTDASTVIQDEKESSIGSTSTSQRSSLSVDELSNIAMRALKASKAPTVTTTEAATPTMMDRKKSPRRRKQQFQRFSRNPSPIVQRKEKEDPKPAEEAEDKEEVPPPAKKDTAAPTRPAPESRFSSLKAAQKKAGARSLAAHGGRGLGSKKKSRYELFETARQRAAVRSPSPLTMAKAPTDNVQPASSADSSEKSVSSGSSGKKQALPSNKKQADKSKPAEEEKEPPSRLAILSAGRKQMSSSPVPFRESATQKSGPPGHRRQSSAETIGDESNRSQDSSTASRRDRRAARMAVLAAAHRQSPVPRAAPAPDSKTSEPPAKSSTPASSSPYATRKAFPNVKKFSTNKDERPNPEASVKIRASRLLELSSSTRSPSPLFMRKSATTVSKEADRDNSPLKKPVAKPVSSTETSSPSRKEAASSMSPITPIKTGSPSRELKSIVPGEPSPTGSAFDSPVSYHRVSKHPAVLAKKSSPARQPKSSSHESSPQRKSSPSDIKPASRSAEKRSPNHDNSWRNDAHSDQSRSRKAARVDASGDRQSSVYKPVTRSAEKTDDSWRKDVQAHSRSKTGEVSSASKSSPSSDFDAFQHVGRTKEKAAALDRSPVRNVQREVESRNEVDSSVANASRSRRPSAEKPQVFDDSWYKKTPKQQETSSDVSSSHGGVRAAIDAWSSKSKETKNADTTPKFGSPRRLGWQSREEPGPNQLGVYLTSPDDVNAVSSETSVGDSHASTFVSSPSSYGSSKFSVGAPGSFFRPMAPAVDFEEPKNTPILLDSTDEDSSALPSHLFKSTSADEDDRSKSDDAELSFLLEQMESEGESESSGIRPLQVDEQDEDYLKDKTDQSTLIGQYHIKSSSSSEDASVIQRTGPDEYSYSTLTGSGIPFPIAENEEHSLNDNSKSSSSTNSRIMKWWQNTDPMKRRQKFEPRTTARTVNRASATAIAMQSRTASSDDDDLFSGLGSEDASQQSPSKTEPVKSSVDAKSFDDDVFSGVTPSADSKDLATPQVSNAPVKPVEKELVPQPPPPPPVLEQSESHQFGTILVNGSKGMDSVDSDITSSVLGNDVSKDHLDWRRHEATAVIKEELTAEIEEEEDTQEGDVTSDRKPKGESDPSRKSHGTPSESNCDEPKSTCKITGGLDDKTVGSEMRGDSIFMSLGRLVDAFPLCGGVDQTTFDDAQSIHADEAESHAVTSEAPPVVQSALNEQERRVWDEWDRKDSCEEKSSQVQTIAADTKAMSTSMATSHISQRRENAHKKLLKYAEDAQLVSGSETDTVESTETSSRASKECVSESVKPSPDEASNASLNVSATHPTSNSLSLSQRRILEKFSSTLKHQGLEILKLNRDKKWQVRFLTVSKEVSWLKGDDEDGRCGDRGQCPLGILWAKRFNAAKEYSVSMIDRHGRGGLLFEHLTKVSASRRSDQGHPLGKKYQDKFKDSVSVTLEYSLSGSPKSVIVRCKTTDEAHFLCTGLRVIIDVLQRDNAAAPVIDTP